jgi:myo-inositol-1-phosphate synthase
MSLEDGPACAAIVTDVIRMTKLAWERGQTGPLITVSAYGFKAPPKRIPDQTLKQDLASLARGTKRT